MPRMKILNSLEREVFDFPPIFNSVEPKRCFDFPMPLQDIATSANSTNKGHRDNLIRNLSMKRSIHCVLRRRLKPLSRNTSKMTGKLSKTKGDLKDGTPSNPP